MSEGNVLQMPTHSVKCLGGCGKETFNLGGVCLTCLGSQVPPSKKPRLSRLRTLSHLRRINKKPIGEN